MKLCILEDELPQAEQLTEYLARFRQERTDFDYVLETYDRGFKLLDGYRRDADLLFLDIQLPDMLGIDVARRIREIDQKVMIIFVTNLSQYAMYLGYRYTETRYEDSVLGSANVGDYNWSDVVAFPFGHGLSYTTFSYSNFKAVPNGDRHYDVSIDVTNTGSTYSGKEVVQFYIAKPYGDYAKENQIQVPSVELVDFGKTGILAPGATETLKVTVDERFFAAFDAYGAGTYVLMPGDYYLIAATDAHNAVNNLLAAKGADSAKMIGTGDAAMTVKFTMDLDTNKFAYGLVFTNEAGGISPTTHFTGTSRRLPPVSAGRTQGRMTSGIRRQP